MIQLEQVSFSYGVKPLLKNFTLKLEPGLCHIILGPSGSGKSTLLKLIAGLLRPTSGQIQTPKTFGYVLQEGGLFYHLNVADNISIQGLMRGWSTEKIRQRTLQLCELTQFPSNLLPEAPSEISGGQRQRVSLMRALFLDPEVLLLDESLSALDPILKYDLMRELKAIVTGLKKTTVHVTHDLMEAAVLGDRIVLLNEGKLEESASKVDFFKNPQTDFAKKFIQSQKVTEL
jgi:osmoprotectant transport system ATP-binding protein